MVGGWTQDGARWTKGGWKVDAGWMEAGWMDAGWTQDGGQRGGLERWQHLAVQGPPGRDVEPHATAVQVEPSGVGASQAELEPGAARVPRRRQPGHQAPVGAVLRDLREQVPEAAAPVTPGCCHRGVRDGDTRLATPCPPARGVHVPGGPQPPGPHPLIAIPRVPVP